MERSDLESRTVGLARLAIGAVQGAALWAILHSGSDPAKVFVESSKEAWQVLNPGLFASLFITFGFVPVLLLGGLRQMRARTLAIWIVLTAAALAALGWHAGWKQNAGAAPWPDPPAILMLGAALFVVHHLIAADDEQRRIRAPYAAYFDVASKHGVQLALSVAFTGAFWLLLFLGAALFEAIDVKGFGQLINKLWFALPASTVMFAAAVHLTDVRSGFVQGIRTVALTLLSWLLPLMTAITWAFLVTLIFTGLQPLFDTGLASEVMLGAVAALIILINAAYQDGDDTTRPPAVLRWAARAAAVALAPICVLAAYALALRIGQYGLTPERVIAAACVVVGSGYAVGYLIAAVRRGPWMHTLELTNIIIAWLTAVLLMLLASPLGDPARLSVANQVERLKSGKITPEKFDFNFLRFEGARYGRQVLAELTRSADADVAAKARTALARTDRYRPQPLTLETWPVGRTVPREIVDADRDGTCSDAGKCLAVFADLDRDGQEEITVFGTFRGQVYALQSGQWRYRYAVAGLCNEYPALAKGEFELAAPQDLEFVVKGRRLSREPGCEATVTAVQVMGVPSSDTPAPSAPPAKAPPPAR